MTVRLTDPADPGGPARGTGGLRRVRQRIRKLALAAVLVLALLDVPASPASVIESAAASEPDQPPGNRGAIGSTNVEAVAVPEAATGPSSWDQHTGDHGVDELRSSARSVPVTGTSRHLQVKILDPSVRLVDGVLDDGPGVSALDEVLASASVESIEPLFLGDQTERSSAHDADDDEADPLDAAETLIGVERWFVVTAASSVASSRLAADLAALPAVEMVQPDFAVVGTATQPAQFGPIVANDERRQGYLDGAPVGVDAEWAWSQPGGTGSEVTVAVIDSGFSLDHFDMGRASAPGVAVVHEPAWDARHGLHVLGVLVADDDDAGLRGIVPEAGIHTVNSGRSGIDMARAIELVSDRLGPGDVISISQGIAEGSVVLPLVYSSVVRDALRAASAKGIISVVSAGNGGAQLDSYADRLGADAPDTIVVGAGAPGPAQGCSSGVGARSPVATSNRGSRVDLQGWGACVRTAAPGDEFTWWGFTSAATPIVAGAAASLSSMVQVTSGVALSGSQVRTVLQQTGTSQTGSGRIGPMPDLRSAMGADGPVPVNDRWASAVAVDEAPTVFSGTSTEYAGIELDEPAPSCGSVGHTVWYELVVPRAMTLTIDTNGSDHDTVLTAWRQRGRRLVEVACNDDLSRASTRSRIDIEVEPGQRYFVQAGGSRSAFGTLQLRVRSDGSGFGHGCDLDADGRGDLLVGDPAEGLDRAEDAGRVVVLPGTESDRPEQAVGVSQEWAGVRGGSRTNDRFGAAIGCGDFDGDGDDDLAVGSPGKKINGARNAGLVRIIAGSSSGLRKGGAVTITQALPALSAIPERGDRFGGAMAVGDFDGDGYDDLAVASPGEDRHRRRNAGLVHVLFGSGSGLGTRAATVDFATKGVPGSPGRGDFLGTALTAGDLDFDGRDELIIGVPGRTVRRERQAGAVVIVPGRSGRTIGLHSRLVHQGQPRVAGKAEAGDRFGAVVAAARIGADAYADVAVGIPGQGRSGISGSGAIEVFSGGANGLEVTAESLVDARWAGSDASPSHDTSFGAAIAIGDVDGDGYAEIVIGVPGTDGDRGAVMIVPGRRRGIAPAHAMWLAQGDGQLGERSESGDRFGEAVAVVDLDGDGRGSVAVGVPGESLRASRSDRVLPGVGRIALFGIGADRAVQLRPSITQSSPAGGVNEAHDEFGAVLLA